MSARPTLKHQRLYHRRSDQLVTEGTKCSKYTLITLSKSKPKTLYCPRRVTNQLSQHHELLVLLVADATSEVKSDMDGLGRILRQCCEVVRGLFRDVWHGCSCKESRR